LGTGGVGDFWKGRRAKGPVRGRFASLMHLGGGIHVRKHGDHSGLLSRSRAGGAARAGA